MSTELPRTARGLRVFGTFSTVHHGTVTAIESTLQDAGLHCWLRAHGGADALLQLNADEAKQLMGVLQTFIDESHAEGVE